MIKILIVDDHPVVREGLKQIIDLTSDITVGGEALNEHEAWQKVDAEDWDAIVLDIGLPGRDGLEVLKDLHRDFPEIHVLVLSMNPEEQVGIRTLKAGAAGYYEQRNRTQRTGQCHSQDTLRRKIRQRHIGRKACLTFGYP